MKKGLLTLAATVLISTAAQAAYMEFSVYAYLDSNGVQVGTKIDPCFDRPNKIIGTVTNKKVLIEHGTCH